jgi:hypothetical protein
MTDAVMQLIQAEIDKMDADILISQAMYAVYQDYLNTTPVENADRDAYREAAMKVAQKIEFTQKVRSKTKELLGKKDPIGLNVVEP